MPLNLQRGLTRSARLVFDVREWFASAFGPVARQKVKPPDAAQPVEVRTIVRPDVQLTVTASPTVPRHPRWPFAGPVELVLTRTPAGMFAYFGRVRSVGGGPLRRLSLEATECRLDITAPGYQPVTREKQAIPASHEGTRTLLVELLPGLDYPFPVGPTLLRGWVVQPGGTGIEGAKVEAKDHPKLKAATSDALGQWVLILDPEDNDPPPASPIDLKITIGNSAPVPLDRVPFAAKQVNRMPQTSVRGVVVRRNSGQPVADAVVTLAPLVGETKTRIDGTWLFYPDLTTPLSGSQVVTIRVQPPGQQPAPAPVVVTLDLGKANVDNIPPITV